MTSLQKTIVKANKVFNRQRLLLSDANPTNVQVKKDLATYNRLDAIRSINRK